MEPMALVAERPLPPVLSLDPQHPFYILGEELSLNCKAPKGQAVVIYRFFKDEQGLRLRELFLEHKGLHKTLQVGENTPGQYVCMYWMLTQDRRQIQSLKSNTVSIAVRDPPPTPELKVDPPSGQVSEGHTLLITCSFNGSHTGKSFHFYKDGVEIGATNQASMHCSKGPGGASSNISLSICLQAQPNHTGEFACRYEENMSGRWIMSPWSQKVKVTEPSNEHQEELESGERESIPLQSRGSQTFPITEPSRSLPPPTAPQTPNRVPDLPAEP
ncbi:Fc receptor-like protein 5 [Anolis carolinensis]|uniref:Fc receptor-like protein 5 n=1 Tax=Anolis carolinensis TaxID=28377 RepID=UPI002F2B767E